MKIVIRTFLFHVFCIILFALIYSNISEDFQNVKQNRKGFIDFLLLSTTIQAGVGMSELHPLSYYGKVIVIIQQMLMLFTHVITLYIFTL
jgi:hypothetical protein